jgi:hypothetical protein
MDREIEDKERYIIFDDFIFLNFQFTKSLISNKFIEKLSSYAFEAMQSRSDN